MTSDDAETHDPSTLATSKPHYNRVISYAEVGATIVKLIFGVEVSKTAG